MVTTMQTRDGQTVQCERGYNLETLTRRQCRECSLCNYNRNCNNTPVGPSEFDYLFAGDEADAPVYIKAVGPAHAPDMTDPMPQ